MVAATRALDGAADVVRCHHERWDGHGYPSKTPGPEIPLAARVFAVADTLDAITSDRAAPPRPPAVRRARGDPLRSSGTQFDPQVVEAFEEFSDEELLRIGAAATG